MTVDHFDGRSLRRRPDEWLMAAIADCHLKLRDCGGSPAHRAIWSAKADEYVAEQVRRDLAIVANNRGKR
jgi:hypothetical protein